MKTLLDLCEEYGIPIIEEENCWVGPCIWSFDEQQSLRIDPLNDRWEDWITGYCGDIIDFVTRVEERLAHLGRSGFSSDDWFAEVKNFFGSDRGCFDRRDRPDIYEPPSSAGFG